jgi:hypothetical protein
MATLQVENRAPLSTASVAREKGISMARFEQQYVIPRVPVVLCDAMDGWQALQWTPESLAGRLGERKVFVAYGSDWRKMTLSSLVSTSRHFAPVVLRTGTSQYSLYLRNRHIGIDFPELLGEFEIPRYFAPNWLAQGPLSRRFPFHSKELTEFFLGHPGARGPVIHQDAYRTHAWVGQIYGRKTVWMLPPDAPTCFYPCPDKPNHSLLNDFEFPDRDRFPEYDSRQVLRTTLTPGETLFIPSAWWHTAECETTSISLSGNFANRTNWDEFSAAFWLFRQGRRRWYHRLVNRFQLQCHGQICSWRCRTGT